MRQTLDKVSAKKENDKMMTFREAVKALDAEGVYAAKRPSMLGYAYKETAIVDEATAGGTAGASSVYIVAKDGSKITIDLAFDDRGDIKGAEGISSVALTAELATALVFASDWELAKREELEKARAGEGTM